jgi:predicted O-methyltransferase YrrM
MTNLLEYKPLESIRSSYKKNNLGRTLEIMTLGYKPRLIVECGILDGYSLYHFAKATKSNSESNYFDGHVIAYDLFEDYKFKHGNAIDVYNMLKHEGVTDYATILQGDAYKVHESYEEGEIDLLHIDIANDGNTFLKMFELWASKISRFGRIVFEGGSQERDRVGWMKKYNKRSIRSVLPKLTKNKKWQVTVIKEWPSLTVMKRI